jgi:hypothetical protein
MLRTVKKCSELFRNVQNCLNCPAAVTTVDSDLRDAPLQVLIGILHRYGFNGALNKARSWAVELTKALPVRRNVRM